MLSHEFRFGQVDFVRPIDILKIILNRQFGSEFCNSRKKSRINIYFGLYLHTGGSRNLKSGEMILLAI